jgi:putative hydrolase of the HAD superfamily
MKQYAFYSRRMAESSRGAGGKRGLLLDFGGVISYSPFEQLEAAEQRLGLAPGTLAWRGPLAPGTDSLWQAMRSGELSERRYWELRAQEVGRLFGEDWCVQDFMRRMRPADPNAAIRPEARDTIRTARRLGLRVGILTNELELFYGKAFLEELDVLKEVHCIVDATHTGILKPRPEAYALGLEALGTAACDTLFVDDQPRNIDGAVRVGLQVVSFNICDPAGSYRCVNGHLA